MTKSHKPKTGAAARILEEIKLIMRELTSAEVDFAEGKITRDDLFRRISDKTSTLAELYGRVDASRIGKHEEKAANRIKPRFKIQVIQVDDVQSAHELKKPRRSHDSSLFSTGNNASLEGDGVNAELSDEDIPHLLKSLAGVRTMIGDLKLVATDVADSQKPGTGVASPELRRRGSNPELIKLSKIEARLGISGEAVITRMMETLNEISSQRARLMSRLDNRSINSKIQLVELKKSIMELDKRESELRAILTERNKTKAS